MKIQNLTCVDYNSTNDILNVIVINTNEAEIKEKLNGLNEVNIYNDDGTIIETLIGFTNLSTIKLNMHENTYQVEILKGDNIEVRFAQEIAKRQEIEQQLAATQEALDFIIMGGM